MKNALSGTWLGHPLHPMLTDVPIGSWVAAALLDLAGGAQAGRVARYLVGFGVLAAVPTAAAGLGIMAGAAYLGGHLSFTRGVGVNHTTFQEGVADWTRVALLSELAPDTLVRVIAGGVPVLLVRRGEQVRALSATCVHAGGPLDEGELADGCVRCPGHGSIFRLADGTALRGPAATGRPAWQVRIEGEQVKVRAARR